ncbi:DUF4185 domain-containing protein [Nocardia aurantiaca]|uniref:DUF4185 domain-containing protein n=1 Tax=Nocardia aurantiaca TaxID=2675850 RepID=A0A6I3KR34_9NOCA|nr:DUF4185 domain-containing protein [Nocardia aurantiaca]MTE11897.1 DUF4185 domain-containing protein [Nocardia aurantiaca]
MTARRSEAPATLALSSLAMAGVLLLPAAPATANPLAPWAPPPLNACGETGFDPLAREPNPDVPLPQPPAPDTTIHIQVPIPQFTPVPVPGPRQDNTRITPAPLPADPCVNPCPDIRNDQSPRPENLAPQHDPADPPEDSADSSGDPGTGDDAPAPQPAPEPTPAPRADSGSGGIQLPHIQIDQIPETVPIPIPGGDPQEPQPQPAPAIQPPAPAPVAAPVAPPALDSLALVNQVTGHGSTNRTDMRWSVDGTDLGIMWESKPGQIAVAFGDTFGKGWGPVGAGTPDQDWRSNSIAFSSNRDLSRGLRLDTFAQDSRCHAAEILSSRKVDNFEITTIPTSGFALNGRQYLTYMSVARWSRHKPGMWWTNLGGLAWSDDNGRTWTKSEWARWDNVFGLGRFQVMSMTPHHGYVYMFGTPNGRFGTIALARVPTDQVLNKSAYQYWIGDTWVPAIGPDDLLATPVVSGTAGELSVRFDKSTGQWQMLYLDLDRHAIVLRTAAEPQGAWTDPVTLVDSNDYPTTYGGYIHPWSRGKNLYFTMSAWNSYNVYLMHATLK